MAYTYNAESYVTLAEAETAREADVSDLWVNTELWIQIRSITQQPSGGWLSGEAVTTSDIVSETFSGDYSLSSPLMSLNHMPVSASEILYFVDLYYNAALDNIPEIFEEEEEV